MMRDRSLFLGFFVLGLVAGAGLLYLLRAPRAELPDRPAYGRPAVLFNQQIVEDVRSAALDLNDPLAVFAHVFAQLPARVAVYPTENYYYFTFWSGGQEIHGNLRLDAADREAGLLSFGYFGQHGNPMGRDDFDYLSHFQDLGAADGVLLEQLDPLTWAVQFREKRVVFALHDVPQTVPAGLALQPGERFMARAFDESGFQLLLVYDQQRPAFRFILDPTAPLPDVLEEADEGIFIGRLSGFAFLEDSARRKILFGVNTNNIRMNNYYDGPFDQLADNFVADTSLQAAMEAAYPSLRGRIDERGVYLDEQGERLSSRLAMTPYMVYSSTAEVQQAVARCRQHGQGAEINTIRCLTFDYKQGVAP